MQIIRTRRGARLVDGRDVVSDLLDHAGPTDSLFDVLAACVAALVPATRIAMLGFAAGGLVPPLRAMRCHLPLHCVDASTRGIALFHELASTWAGDVRIAHADAVDWLRRQRRRYDLVLEDLSLASTRRQVGGKPEISYTLLPRLIRQRLATGGVSVTNLLPVPGRVWTELESTIARHYRRAVVLHFKDYENRVVIAGDRLAPTPLLSRAIRARLRQIGSLQSERVRLRSLATTRAAG